jgi:hypothetical protein
MNAVFKHDCENCTFLGHFYDHDVYTCGKSIVARYSDEPSKYASLPRSVFIDALGSDSWADDKAMRAMAAGVSCQALHEIPRSFARFASIADVKHAVDRLKWDMLFGPNRQDIVPDPNWGLEADTAFQHFYIARSLLEQAEHHLAIADAHDRECWKKYREKREAQEAANEQA